MTTNEVTAPHAYYLRNGDGPYTYEWVVALADPRGPSQAEVTQKLARLDDLSIAQGGAR